jgi:MerR family transcriptional regulator, copper efflux regulator
MRIGDAAAAAGTTPRALRFYEANGLLPAPQRTRAGQRVYGPREVARLRVIRELLSLGFTIADIRDCAGRLDLLEGDTLPPYGGPGVCASQTGIARRRIAAFDAEIARLTALRDQLATRIGVATARLELRREDGGNLPSSETGTLRGLSQHLIL